MNNPSVKYIALTFLAALAVIAMMAAFTALSPTLQWTARAQGPPTMPPVPTNTPEPTRTPKPPMCQFLIATGANGAGRGRHNPMQFTGTVAKSDFRPVNPAIDGSFDAVNVYGTAECRWTATPNVPWISMYQNSGTVPPDDVHEGVHFTINDRARELPAGHHQAVIRFQVAAGKIGGPNSLYVNLHVREPCRFHVENTYLRYSMKQGQDPSSIEPLTITISNRDNAGDCTWQLSPDVKWLSVEPSNGVLPGGRQQFLSVRVNDGASTLPARNGHQANIRFSGELINSSIGGQLDIEPPPCNLRLDSTKAAFDVRGPQGGPFEPDVVRLLLKNTGGAPCQWHTTPGGWIDIAPNTGDIPPNGGTPIEVTIRENANSKTPGEYSDTITFNAGGTGSDNSITINLTVGPLPCKFAVGVIEQLDFKRYPNGKVIPENANIAIANAPHRQECVWVTTSPQWLTVTPDKGVLAAGTNAVVAVAVASDETSDLAPQQTHAGTVRFLAPSETNGSENIATSLELECLEDEPCVALHSSRTSIIFGEIAELTLTMRNPLSRNRLTVNLSLEIPSGWSLEAGDFDANCSSGLCASRHLIPPGDNQEIRILASPNAPNSEPRDSVFTGRVEHFYDDRGRAETYEIQIPITVGAASEQVIADFRQPTNTPPPVAAVIAPTAPIAGSGVTAPAPEQNTPAPPVAAMPLWQDWRVLAVGAVIILLFAGLILMAFRGRDSHRTRALEAEIRALEAEKRAILLEEEHRRLMDQEPPRPISGS